MRQQTQLRKIQNHDRSPNRYLRSGEQFFALVMMAMLTASALSLVTVAGAAQSEPASEAVDTSSQPPVASNKMESMRAVRLQYAPLDLLLPSKWGVAVQGQVLGETVELDYASASVSVPWILKDLGSMSEKRLQLNFISPIGESANALQGWNFRWGLSLNSFQIRLGDALLSRLSGGVYPSLDVVDLQTLGVVGSIGYRRLWGNLQQAHWGWGVDLFSWAQPLITTKNSAPFLDAVTDREDRESVEQAIRVVRLFPRWTLGRFSVAYRF